MTKPTMTKKDFAAIARIINAERGNPVDGRIQIARAIADHCATRNPDFDRARFLEACGVSDGRRDPT